MPIVNLYMKKGKTKEDKRYIMNFISSSINKATGTDFKNIFIYINETEPQNITNEAPVVTVSWAAVPARTNEAKKQIMAEVSKKLAEFTGSDLENVVVTFTDLPLTNVAMGGIARE